MPPNLLVVDPSACEKDSKISRLLVLRDPDPGIPHREVQDHVSVRADSFSTSNTPRPAQ